MALSWHPDNPTQLALACDDNRFPYINIWDLRKSAAPISVLSGFHGAGITDLSWSTHDSNLLLATSKDGKTVCWSIKSGEPMSELMGKSTTNMQWSPILPSLYTNSTSDGVVQVYSQHDAINKNLFKGRKVAEITAPNWLKKNTGISFGFGRRVLKFTQNENGKTSVTLNELPADPKFCQIVRDFDSFVSQGTLDKLCAVKSKENADSKSDSMEWKFLEALVINKNESILNALGYNPES